MSKKSVAAVVYAALFALGVLLFYIAHAYATRERGYTAYGGEIFFVGLPLIVWLIKSTVGDIFLHEQRRNP